MNTSNMILAVYWQGYAQWGRAEDIACYLLDAHCKGVPVIALCTDSDTAHRFMLDEESSVMARSLDN